jgi:hypothetical protein
MKAARPTGGMFEEDGEEGAPVDESKTNGIENGTDKDDDASEEDKKEVSPSDDASAVDSTTTDTSSLKRAFAINFRISKLKKPKQRVARSWDWPLKCSQ